MELTNKLEFEIKETILIASTRDKAEAIGRQCQRLFDNDYNAEVMTDKLCKLIDNINELKEKVPDIYKVFSKAEEIHRHLTKIQ